MGVCVNATYKAFSQVSQTVELGSQDPRSEKLTKKLLENGSIFILSFKMNTAMILIVRI